RPANAPSASVVALAVLGVLPFLAEVTPGRLRGNPIQEYWSPYYRIRFDPVDLDMSVNLLGHQRMEPLDARNPAYALPHLLHRDSGGAPPKEILIIGSGSGNDVSRALQ